MALPEVDLTPVLPSIDVTQFLPKIDLIPLLPSIDVTPFLLKIDFSTLVPGLRGLVEDFRRHVPPSVLRARQEL